jgi:hypothetical protein
MTNNIIIPFVHKNSGSGSITVKQVEGKTGESKDDLGSGVSTVDSA